MIYFDFLVWVKALPCLNRVKRGLCRVPFIDELKRVLLG